MGPVAGVDDLVRMMDDDRIGQETDFCLFCAGTDREKNLSHQRITFVVVCDADTNEV